MTATPQPPPPDEDQRRLILEALDSNMLVEAAAGTGKTTSMVGRMVALLRSGTCASIRNLAAVTFTRKAASELHARFQVALQQALAATESSPDTEKERERLGQALDNVEQCFIGTIHSFCARLLRERPVEAGLDLAFEELDPEEDARLRNEAWAAYTAELLTSDEPTGPLERLDRRGLSVGDLQASFNRFADYPDVQQWPVPGPDSDLPDLEPAVRALREYLEHMQALAPRLPEEAGTDKLIPEYRRLPRIAFHYEDLYQPQQLMEMLARFDRRSISVVQKVWAAQGKLTAQDAKAERQRWLDFRQEVVQPLLTAWYEHRYGACVEVLQGALQVYDRLRRLRGKLNYQDLLMQAARLLRDKPHVRRYFARRFTHLLVDEFQDTDPIQAEVMLLLTATDPRDTNWRTCVPRPGSLFVVGDPKQSIYRFRRADIMTYNQVKRIVEGDGSRGKVIQLSTNFRTCGGIVDWVNRVFEPLFPDQATDASPCYVSLQQGRVEGAEGQLAGVRVLRIPEPHCKKNDPAVQYEAELIARSIRCALDSELTVPRTSREQQSGRSPRVGPDDFLIVTRRKANLSIYARKLQEHGIPHAVTGGSALNQVPALKLLHTFLAAVTQPDNPVALVAVLRGELFGISDAALYAFKRASGIFAYATYRTQPLPGDLEPAEAAALADAFARLNIARTWLDQLPPLAAIEKMVASLGLMVTAGAADGGDVEAGSLAKALELLREAQRNVWSVASLVEHLGQLVDLSEPYDGISALSEDPPKVRIMNLHKVKGLEAPVVFLADPTGWRDPSREQGGVVVDRSGGRVRGYLAIDEPRRIQRRGPGRRLAQPPGWEELASIEQEFLLQEELRLLYVAATRAGAQLVISQRDKSNAANPWKLFDGKLTEAEQLLDPGPRAAPPRETGTLALDQVHQALRDIEQRLDQVRRPTYLTSPAKAYALSTTVMGLAQQEAPSDLTTEGEHGLEWGAVVHQLLEVAMLQPNADLLRQATAALLETELDPRSAELAVQTVRSVMASDLWKRARQSGRLLVEAPFSIPTAERQESGPPIPLILRGVIDLVFLEEGGWVLVDYKTDRALGKRLEALVSMYADQVRLYARAWQRCTAEPVKEVGLFFTSVGEYRQVNMGMRREDDP